MDEHADNRANVFTGAPQPRPRRRLLALALMSLLVLASAGTAYYERTHRTTAAEASALSRADKTANVFKGGNDQARARLNLAVKEAFAGRCQEARAIHKETIERYPDFDGTERNAYKKRIEQVCSGQLPPPVQE